MSTDKEPTPWSKDSYWQGRFETGDTPWQLAHPSSVVCEALDLLTQIRGTLSGTKVLSPGCGRGFDAIELARRGAHVIAVDWSPTAVRDLQAYYESVRSTLAGSIRVVQGDFFTLATEKVDLVVEHTFFCAIDPTLRTQYVQAVHAWLAPGGYLVGNFFVVDPDVVERLPGLSLAGSEEGPPFATTVDELHSLFGASFDFVALQCATRPEPDRRPGLEWVGVLRMAERGGKRT